MKLSSSFLGLFLCISVVLFSCAPTSTAKSVAEKAAGVFNGTFTYSGQTRSGTVTIVKATDNTVNMTVSIPTISINSTCNGASVTESGSSLTVSYTNSGTSDGTVNSLDGSITGSDYTNLVFNSVIRYLGIQVAFAFDGAK
jgi:hypothetical protein